jgi:hypothetical protein
MKFVVHSHVCKPLPTDRCDSCCNITFRSFSVKDSIFLHVIVNKRMEVSENLPALSVRCSCR